MRSVVGFLPFNSSAANAALMENKTLKRHWNCCETAFFVSHYFVLSFVITE